MKNDFKSLLLGFVCVAAAPNLSSVGNNPALPAANNHYLAGQTLAMANTQVPSARSNASATHSSLASNAYAYKTNSQGSVNANLPEEYLAVQEQIDKKINDQIKESQQKSNHLANQFQQKQQSSAAQPNNNNRSSLLPNNSANGTIPGSNSGSANTSPWNSNPSNGWNQNQPNSQPNMNWGNKTNPWQTPTPQNNNAVTAPATNNNPKSFNTNTPMNRQTQTNIFAPNTPPPTNSGNGNTANTQQQPSP